MVKFRKAEYGFYIACDVDTFTRDEVDDYEEYTRFTKLLTDNVHVLDSFIDDIWKTCSYSTPDEFQNVYTEVIKNMEVRLPKSLTGDHRQCKADSNTDEKVGFIYRQVEKIESVTMTALTAWAQYAVDRPQDMLFYQILSDDKLMYCDYGKWNTSLKQLSGTTFRPQANQSALTKDDIEKVGYSSFELRQRYETNRQKVKTISKNGKRVKKTKNKGEKKNVKTRS